MTLNLKEKPYLTINIVFIFLICMIMGYSLINSPDEGEYPIPCVHEKLTGQPCVSCGLSHSFSLILLGRTDEALQWNQYGMRIFMFFAIQLVARILFSILWLRFGKPVILFDIFFSSVFLLYSFWPFILWILGGY